MKRRASSKCGRFAVPLWIALLECAGGALGCKVGPDYVKPKVATPAAFQETSTWKLAAPGDDLPRGAWWEIFRDPELDELESKVLISNQTIANAAAQYRGAQAALRRARAGFFPTLGANLSVTHARSSSSSRGGTIATVPGSGASAGSVAPGQGSTTFYSLPLSLSWEADLWGRVRRLTESSEASAQASLADSRVGEALGPVRACADVFQPSLARCPKGAARGGHARFRVGPRGHQESLCGRGGFRQRRSAS